MSKLKSYNVNLKLKIKKESSFTLLELLVVIAVIAILAAIVLVSLSSANQRAWEARGMNFSQNVRTTLATDLVGEWTFDTTDIQGNIAKDASGNGNDGTIYGATPEPKGRVRQARKFDGVDDYVDVGKGDQGKLNFPSESFTVEFWLKSNETCPAAGAYCGWILDTKGAGSIARGYDIIVYQDKIHFRVSNGSIFFGGLSNSSVTNGNWYHFAGVIDRTNNRFKVFINGTQEKNESQNFSGSFANSYPLLIGKYNGYTSGDYVLNGILDELRIYKRALTTYEIKALYAQGKMRHLADR